MMAQLVKAAQGQNVPDVVKIALLGHTVSRTDVIGGSMIKDLIEQGILLDHEVQTSHFTPRISSFILRSWTSKSNSQLAKHLREVFTVLDSLSDEGFKDQQGGRF